MNIKVYLLASMVAPIFALLYIITGLSIDAYTGHFNLSQELADGGVFFLLLSYFLFVFICAIATFVIVFFNPLVLKAIKQYNRRNFLISGAFTGACAAIITLALMADGNLTRENGFYTLWFGLAGMIIGFISAYIYNKFAYALEICD